MSARETILNRIRAGLSAKDELFRDTTLRRELPPVPSPVTAVAGDKLSLARHFGTRLERIHGSYEMVAGPADAAAAVVRVIREWDRDQDTVLAWAAAELEPPDLAERLEGAGLRLLVPDDMHDEECRRNAARPTVGVTGVEAAFAGTGSMVLVPGAGRSRAAALLPTYHVAVIPFSRIYPTMEAWLAVLRDQGRLTDLFRSAGQVAFVTGPSKSADIELNLTLGVHGPRVVHAVIFDDG